MERFDIPDARDPSVVHLRRRRVIQTPLFGIYLHHIYQPDSDRDPHDHPWPFVSIMLRGGYSEEVWQVKAGELGATPRTIARRRWSAHGTGLRVAHIIRTLRPGTVTLVLTGRHSRTWGFWTPQGFVPWMRYVAAKAGPDPFGLPEDAPTGNGQTFRGES
jgi:hypothetical protein